MKKWYDEEYKWEIEVIGFNKDNEETERCPLLTAGLLAY